MVLSGWIHCETWLNICQFLKSLLLIAADYIETSHCLNIDTRKLWHEYESSSLQSNAFHLQAVVLSMEAISAEVMLHWNLHSATLACLTEDEFPRMDGVESSLVEAKIICRKKCNQEYLNTGECEFRVVQSIHHGTYDYLVVGFT